MLKLHIGCVTNSHRRLVTRTLRNTALLDYFEAIITADDVLRPKPAPDMILKVCRELGVMPSSAVFVGDTETDLIAAARAGCIFVGYQMDTSISIKGLEELAGWIKMEMNRPVSRT
jgi:HAD superfamily hydrolase (TIGR01509 family)